MVRLPITMRPWQQIVQLISVETEKTTMKICPTIELPERPEVDLNSSKQFRVAVVGDVDGNDGLPG